VVHQQRLPITPTEVTSGLLGIPAFQTVADQQQDVYKELLNKIAWAIGSTYRQSYSGTRSNVRAEAGKVVRALIWEHGYPASIAK